MITINVRAILLYGLLFFVAWFGRSVWFQAAALLIELPVVRAGLIGFVIGVALRANWAWNAALAYRRDQAVEKAEREYAQDRRKVV